MVIDEDEEGKRFREEKIGSLPPAFSKNGTITAANASKINDGACSVSNLDETQLSPQRIKSKNWG